MKHCLNAICLVILALTLCGCRAGEVNMEVPAQQGAFATEPERLPPHTSQPPEATPEVQTEPPASRETTLPFTQPIPDQVPTEDIRFPGGENWPEDVRLKFAEILIGDNAFGVFFSHSYQRELSLSGYLSTFAEEIGVNPAITKYAVLDMDDDAVPELLLWLTINEYTDYGTIVLTFRNGQVEEYTFSYRQLFELKEDGSFSCSGGASGSGNAKLEFTEDGWQYHEVTNENQDLKAAAQWYALP